MARAVAMIIVCEKCSTKFKVADEKIKPGGVKVRCSKCKSIFKVNAATELAPSPSSSDEDVNLNFNLDDDPTVKTKTPKKKNIQNLNLAKEDLGLEIEIDSPGIEETKKTKPPPKKKPLDLNAADLGLDLEPSAPPKKKKKAKKAKKAKPPEPPKEDLFEQPSEDSVSGPSNDEALMNQSESPGLDASLAGEAAEIEAIDKGLEDLLKDPNKPSEDLLDPFDAADSDLPLTMPDDIDLNSLVDEKQTEGRSPVLKEFEDPFAGQIQDPLVKNPPGKITDDGIELVGSSKLKEDPRSIPLDTKTPSVDLTPSRPRPVPPITSKSKVSAATLAFPQDKSSAFGRFLAFLLFLVLLLGGVSTYVVYQVHGKFNFSKVNLATFSEFFQNAQSPGKSQTLTEEPKEENLITIYNTTTHLVRNVDDKNILIISGEAKNEYDTARSFIRVKVQIFSSSGEFITEKEVWAGNHFTRNEIYYFPDQQTIDGEYINAGEKLSNLNVQPENSIPFQIIVFNPPENWKEFKAVPSFSQPAFGN